ncbi:MAG: YegS/Rv2252/BmrU family lipid kinase [Lachnospiraceae bacterium]|nr:YegS/Rv2252/BmrU family lipid kinase [Candidatus Equihabitans merdae]
MYEILINPMSRSGKGRHAWHEIESELKSRGVKYRAHFSGRKGDIARMAAELTKEPCQILVLGGDGTFNEFVQGVQDFDNTEVGFLPLGSGNDFCKGMKYPKDMDAILDRILDIDQPMKMDVGVLEYGVSAEDELKKRRFLISCGSGFDAAVCHYVDRSKLKVALNKVGLGKLVYLMIAVREIFTAKRTSVRLTSDGKVWDLKNYLFAAAMNTRYEGGGFMFGPKADHADGQMDLCLVGEIPPLKVTCVLPTAFAGKHFIFKNVDRDRAKETIIEAVDKDQPFFLHTDGEVMGQHTYARISSEDKQLNLLWDM